MTPAEDSERLAACCLPGGVCHEAGLSDAQHKLDAPKARAAIAAYEAKPE